MKKNLNKIASIEKAIAKKYGEEAIQNPRKYWTDEKEEEYNEQIKKLNAKEDRFREKTEKIEVNGVFVTKKLLNKEHDRICPVCEIFSFNLHDSVYMTKYNCCKSCYIRWVEEREERWETGWRPSKENK
jgi:hypothetical protein